LNVIQRESENGNSPGHGGKEDGEEMVSDLVAAERWLLPLWLWTRQLGLTQLGSHRDHWDTKPRAG